MVPLNLATTSSPPPPPPAAANELLAKRKRGRPRKDETLTQQENSQVTPKPDANLVGKMVCGVVEGSFDAGYILNVKVKDSDTKLRGIVFLPEKVTPVTPENDVAPHVKMISREEIKSQTEEDQSQSQSQSLPNDQTMKDADDITDMEIAESAQTLSLLAQESNGKAFTVQAKEAMIEKDGAMETEEAAAKTRLVEFFPTQETTMMTAADQPSLVSAQEETTEQQKSYGETREFDLMAKEAGEKVQEKSPGGESRGFDLMSEEQACQGEKVPKELQLELGNKTIIMSGDGEKSNNGNAAMETDTKGCKSGFIANLFEGEDKKVECDMDEEEKEATPSVK